MKAVIDTNVLLIANGQHNDVSLDCIEACVKGLNDIQANGVTVIDDGYRILGEYQHKTSLKPPKGVGDVFLKHLLRNSGNTSKVEQVSLKEASTDVFDEFPDKSLEQVFDAPDRKFVAVANSLSVKPPIWQAADCKWLNWWSRLSKYGIRVDFLCPQDACKFYSTKFPGTIPILPD